MNVIHVILSNQLLFQKGPHRQRASGSKGKGTSDPIKFLPTLPSKRTKPTWQTNPPNFLLNGGPAEEDHAELHTFDIATDLTARSKFSDK